MAIYDVTPHKRAKGFPPPTIYVEIEDGVLKVIHEYAKYSIMTFSIAVPDEEPEDWWGWGAG